MKRELPEISLSNKGTIKSVELVDIINTFRELESESIGKEYKKLLKGGKNYDKKYN